MPSNSAFMLCLRIAMQKNVVADSYIKPLRNTENTWSPLELEALHSIRLVFFIFQKTPCWFSPRQSYDRLVYFLLGVCRDFAAAVLYRRYLSLGCRRAILKTNLAPGGELCYFRLLHSSGEDNWNLSKTL
jgi:hypothetical protein